MSLPHQSAGTLITAAIWNALIDAINLANASGYSAVVRATTTTQTLTNGTYTAITFGTETFDTDGMHSTSSNTSRFTAVTAGKYLFTAGVAWTSSNAGTLREIKLRKNATTDGNHNIVGRYQDQFGAIHGVSDIFDLAIGDYVELYGYQDTGGNLDITSANMAGCRVGT